jgi:hypothetical protein
MKNIIFRSSILLFPISTLALFQLLAVILSLTNIPFSLNLILSTCGALLVSKKISDTFVETINCSLTQTITILALSGIFGFLFLLRLNWDIYDLICQTGILGLVTQVSNGSFPVSYLSFPEFPMNYHQGTLLIAGVLSGLFKIPAAAALKIVFTSMFFLLNVSAMLFLVATRAKCYFLVPVLFLGISSIPFKSYPILQLGFPAHISVFEWTGSNSWPLAFLVLMALLFIARHYRHTPAHILYCSILILSLSTINALLFQLILVVIPLFIIGTLWQQRKNILSIKYLDIIAASFIVLVTVPKYIPSAFLAGPFYDLPKFKLRFLHFGEVEFLKSALGFLLLLSPLTLFILCVSFFLTLKNKLASWQRLLALLLLVSCVIPILFIPANFVEWDFVHKFALLSQFISILLAVSLLKKLEKKHLFLWSIIIVSVLVSTPVTTDLLTKGTSLNFSSFNEIAPELQDVTDYLSEHKTALVPYKNSQEDYYCTYEKYSAIAQYSGNFLYDSYKTNFFIHPEIEAAYIKNASWNNFEEKVSNVQIQIDNGATLIIDKGFLSEKERSILESSISAESKEFSQYILYAKKTP